MNFFALPIKITDMDIAFAITLRYGARNMQSHLTKFISVLRKNIVYQNQPENVIIFFFFALAFRSSL